MKISIITTVYNRVNSIEKALESVHAQSYKNIEHIIIDGASKDGTVEVIDNFKKSNKNIIFLSEKDNGIYDAINKGISIATGDVIGVMHSDDTYFNNNVLQEVSDSFKENNIDAVYADAVFFDKNYPNIITRRYSSRRFSRNMIRWGWMPAHTSLYLTKETFLKFGSYKVDYKIAADFEFIARIFTSENFKSIYVPSPWIKMQSGGASTNGIKSNIVINKEVIRACKENNIYTNWLMVLSKYFFKITEFFIK